MEANPMHPSIRRLLPLLQAPRCGAKTRSGTPCQSPAVNGKSRCRMHGGSKGSGAPKGDRNGSYRHGLFTCEAIEERRAIKEMIGLVSEFLGSL
ncbi:HGGxSTG domain-containing protein [Microvirga sesbaniae]|uniref:HGGxSTG domain-containing protein n=1 Tax=Microvirga sesbaniae TaxID=681392 RepID=UPI0029055D68|nr:HGGxSTG domain-containing protein [Microvirga sp. HBU67692]